LQFVAVIQITTKQRSSNFPIIDF